MEFVIEGEGFKEFLRTLEPGDNVSTRATVEEVLHKKYSSTRTEIYEAVQNCEAVTFTYLDLASDGGLSHSHITFHHRRLATGEFHFGNPKKKRITVTQPITLHKI